MDSNSFVKFLYSSALGRFLLKLVMYSGVLKLAAIFSRSKLSKFMIKDFIRKNKINMSDFSGKKYENFQEFFSRTRKMVPHDMEKNHLVSPCDGLLSAFPIEDNSIFSIKGSLYKVSDLVTDKSVAHKFAGGDCLIYRLCADDYHHYSFIDDGIQGKNHFVKGLLHSVQPIACEQYPVYKHNRRMWTLLKTENFGVVAQIEVGALLVGGIVNEINGGLIKRGREMGHFELAGSTIVMLFQKDKIELLPEIKEYLATNEEYKVKQGQWVGIKK